MVKSVQSALSDLLTTSATHRTFSRPSTKRGLILILLIIFGESVNRSTCLSVYLISTRLRNVNLLCFSDSIEGRDFLNFLVIKVIISYDNFIAIDPMKKNWGTI